MTRRKEKRKLKQQRKLNLKRSESFRRKKERTKESFFQMDFGITKEKRVNAVGLAPFASLHLFPIFSIFTAATWPPY